MRIGNEIMMDIRLPRLLLSLAIGLAAAWLWLALLAPPAALGAPAGQTFIVNSAADVSDAAPGDGHCATGAGFCTLRAASRKPTPAPAPIPFNCRPTPPTCSASRWATPTMTATLTSARP